MSAPQQPPPPPEAKPKSKTLLYVLLGCGGCLALAGVTGVVLIVLGGFVAKKSVSAGQNMTATVKVAAQESTLSLYLDGDEARTARMTKIWSELGKEASSGELKLEDVEALQRTLDAATSDDKLSAEEADALLAQGEKLTR